MSDGQEKRCVSKQKVHANVFESANPKPTGSVPEGWVKPIAKLSVRNNSLPDISTRPVLLNYRKGFKFFSLKYPFTQSVQINLSRYCG